MGTADDFLLVRLPRMSEEGEFIWVNPLAITHLKTGSSEAHGTWTEINFHGNTRVSTSLGLAETVELLDEAVHGGAA